MCMFLIVLRFATYKSTLLVFFCPSLWCPRFLCAYVILTSLLSSPQLYDQLYPLLSYENVHGFALLMSRGWSQLSFKMCDSIWYILILPVLFVLAFSPTELVWLHLSSSSFLFAGVICVQCLYSFPLPLFQEYSFFSCLHYNLAFI